MYYPENGEQYMIELRSKVTRKGQVTVPADIRKALGLHEGDRVSFLLQNGEVKLEKAGSVIERTAGALRNPSLPSLSDRELKEAIAQSVADDVMERGRKD
jgi:AbrB family looped-hinge helix DNA binding protein